MPCHYILTISSFFGFRGWFSLHQSSIFFQARGCAKCQELDERTIEITNAGASVGAPGWSTAPIHRDGKDPMESTNDPPGKVMTLASSIDSAHGLQSDTGAPKRVGNGWNGWI